MFDGQIFGRKQETLNSSCAQFVQILHTKPVLLGTFDRLGDSDFYANILLPQQPGCSALDSSCSHDRAFELYFASCFQQYKFIGVDSVSSNETVTSRFGFYNDRKSGWFNFETSACFGYDLN